jgi:uncharacterized protein (TIRG00374 family)
MMSRTTRRQHWRCRRRHGYTRADRIHTYPDPEAEESADERAEHSDVARTVPVGRGSVGGPVSRRLRRVDSHPTAEVSSVNPPVPELSLDRRRVGRRGLGALAALATLAVAVAHVGGPFGRALGRADPGAVALVVGIAVAVLVLRGLALRVLLGVLGYRAPVGRVLGAYAATAVVSTLVPGGQAGGAPLNGLLVARSSAADYEDGVAAVVTISALANLVVGAFGLLGVAYLLVTASGGDVTLLAGVGTALFALAVLGLAGLWRVRRRATAVSVAALATLAGALRVVPRATPPDRATVETRVRRFAAALARLRDGSTREVVALVGLLALAHALTVVALWLSFLAVGHPVSVGVLLAVIPAAVAAAVVPTPGGLGGVDVALVALLASGTSAVAPVAGAAVLVYRTATSGPALVGGGAVVVAMCSLGLLGADQDATSR